MCKPMAIKIIGTFGCVSDLVASCRLLWWLSGDAFGNFDLAEQCNRWSTWISLTVTAVISAATPWWFGTARP